MSEARGRIIPVILSGGTGSRLWPLSREACPKQLLSLLDEKTLLQQTALRVADPSLFASPMVIANAEHRFAIGEQLRGVGISDPTIVLEEMMEWLAAQPAGADTTFANYVNTAGIERRRAEGAAAYVEGFNAADANVIGVAGLAQQQRAERVERGHPNVGRAATRQAQQLADSIFHHTGSFVGECDS